MIQLPKPRKDRNEGLCMHQGWVHAIYQADGKVKRVNLRCASYRAARKYRDKLFDDLKARGAIVAGTKTPADKVAADPCGRLYVNDIGEGKFKVVISGRYIGSATTLEDAIAIRNEHLKIVIDENPYIP